MGTSLFIIDDICQARKSRQSLSPLEKDQMDISSALYGRYDPRKVSSSKYWSRFGSIHRLTDSHSIDCDTRHYRENKLTMSVVVVGKCPEMRPDPMETGLNQSLP